MLLEVLDQLDRTSRLFAAAARCGGWAMLLEVLDQLDRTSRLFFRRQRRMATMHFGDTPLIDAAGRGRTADVAALLAGGADVDEPSTDTLVVTALWVACQQGHTGS